MKEVQLGTLPIGSIFLMSGRRDQTRQHWTIFEVKVLRLSKFDAVTVGNVGGAGCFSQTSNSLVRVLEVKDLLHFRAEILKLAAQCDGDIVHNKLIMLPFGNDEVASAYVTTARYEAGLLEMCLYANFFRPSESTSATNSEGAILR